MSRDRIPPILVADDDEIVRKLITHVFTQAGLKIEMFESGDRLLEAVTEETRVCVLEIGRAHV